MGFVQITSFKGQKIDCPTDGILPGVIGHVVFN